VKTWQKFLILSVLVVWTWSILIFHIGTLPPPDVSAEKITDSQSQWIPKSKYGVNQLVLSGSDYARGFHAGQLTKDILRKEERDLTPMLLALIPSRLLLKCLEVPLIRYFWGIEKYFDQGVLREMYGVSLSAPHDYDDLIDGYTRQMVFHGLHEVGQMMVDQEGDQMGCTFVAVPAKEGWVLGRNFDFEGGRVLDEDKVMKWVFPEHGYSFVSVTWAGMVGAVTGINDQGIYVSINAAGSTDYSRYGTPSTLVLLKVLNQAKSAADALEIFKSEQMFITDIFALFDTKSGELYRIEKSPKKTEIIRMAGAGAIANHLLAPDFANDRINEFRRDDLTSAFRQARADELTRALGAQNLEASQLQTGVLQILRDKGWSQAPGSGGDLMSGHALHLGNRRAIDALIATHSVIYNSQSQVLFVSRGPGVSGAFTGFDLAKSFASRTPVVAGELPRDPEVSDELFMNVRRSNELVAEAAKQIHYKRCSEGAATLRQAEQTGFTDSSGYFEALGDLRECDQDRAGAVKNWKRALDLVPAYPGNVKELTAKLKRGE
jgi:hypothetical protein